jgi:hypothetical protein
MCLFKYKNQMCPINPAPAFRNTQNQTALKQSTEYLSSRIVSVWLTHNFGREMTNSKLLNHET